jgi:hypothetical protein
MYELKDWRKVMSKKYGNRILLVVFIILVGFFAVSKFIRSSRMDRTFKTELVLVDTSRVTKIRLYPGSENHEEIVFNRSGNLWTVQKGNVVSETGEGSVENMLNEIIRIKPQRLAANSEEKWKEYQVTDSLATRIKIEEEDGKVTLDMLIGRFSYKQQENPYPAYGRGINGITYVRLADEKEVYAVNGFLSMTLNMGFNHWRNQLIIRTNKSNITKLSFKYPVDSGFVAIKHDTVWTVNNELADSAKIEQYLGTLSYQGNLSFVDGYSPTSNSDYVLTVEGNNMSPVVIQAFRGAEDEFIINSNLNPPSFFRSEKTELFSKIFIRKEELFN